MLYLVEIKSIHSFEAVLKERQSASDPTALNLFSMVVNTDRSLNFRKTEFGQWIKPVEAKSQSHVLEVLGKMKTTFADHGLYAYLVASPKDGAAWCSCQGDMLRYSMYYEDAEHPSFRKHHYRCPHCHGVTQIG